MLNVKHTTLNKFGAVSEQTALEMVRGVIKNSSANIAVSITGIAGPTGGTKTKPIGTVCFGFYIHGEYATITQNFADVDRFDVVEKSVEFTVNFLLKKL
jgi:nicotinamide-nucleotide amidase